MAEARKTVVQCDFDGTITDEDVSFKMLEAYADSDWRQLWKQYRDGNISVGRFNTQAFAMVKADKKSLLEVASGTMMIRPGLLELVACCRRKNFRFVIVSNGLDFYIKDILGKIGLNDIEILAAETQFKPDGLLAQYIGPAGVRLDDGFKEAYVNLFLSEGYRVIYMGNGVSDIASAIKCHHIFATAELLDYCKKYPELNYTELTDFNEAAKILEASF
ncbi:MtnX-like HAD-IB family phosphatase [Chloroflexota bacterium]